VEVARALVQANGLEDRVQVHRGDLGELEPVEPVDVVLCDLVGRFLPDAAMRDAARGAGRWLGPGGVFAPSRVSLRVAPVADLGMPEVDRFQATLLGLDLSPASVYTLNTAYQVQLPASALVAAARQLETLLPPELPDEVSGTARFQAERDGALCGFAGWFEAELAPGVVLDTRPGVVSFWGQVLWPVPRVRVTQGDQLELDLRAASVDGGVDFEWTARVSRGGAELLRTSGESAQRLGRRPHRVEPPSRLDRSGIVAANRHGVEAVGSGQIDEAITAFQAAACSLEPEHDDLAAAIYENLGMARYHAGQPLLATHALLRALDGEPTSREPSCRFLVGCLALLGRSDEASDLLERYQAAYGPHPFAREG